MVDLGDGSGDCSGVGGSDGSGDCSGEGAVGELKQSSKKKV